MRGIRIGVMVLLAMLANVALGGNEAEAVSKARVEVAIERAEAALEVVNTAKVAGFEGEKDYLQARVELAKEMMASYDCYKDANLEELVATLEEGADALRLITGVDRKTEAARTSVTMASDATAQRQVAQSRAIVMQNAADEAPSAGTGAPAAVKTERDVQANKVAKADGDAGVQVKLAVATSDEGVEAQKESVEVEGDVEGGEIEVPKAGGADEEKTNEPSAVAVAITVGVIVGLSAAGAIAIVRRMKRNA